MTEIERGSGNAYADLGLADADEMLVKAQLVTKIAAIIKRRRLTQTEAAGILGIPQPKLSNLLRGQFRGVSEIKLLECLTRLGLDVEINIRSKARRTRRGGQLTVAFG